MSGIDDNGSSITIAASRGGGHSTGAGGDEIGGEGPHGSRTATNQDTLEYYAAGIAGLMAVFILFHWIRFLAVHHVSLLASVIAPFATIFRNLRRILIRPFPGFISAGHGVLVAVYVAINVVVTFTNMVSYTSLGQYAARFGWMAGGNLVLLVFLALKNTPVSFLAGYSYERLQCLHQIVGYTAVLYIVLHIITFAIFFHQIDVMEVFRENAQIAGIIAGAMWIIMALSAILIRRIRYEVFYAIHIVGFIVSVICLAVHVPDLDKILIPTIIAASIWAADRIVRAARVLYYAANNEATVWPLSNGATRVVLKKAPVCARGGKHCFLWMPQVRLFETHPFTIVGTDPLEFVVSSYSGFTRDLAKYALDNRGGTLKASVDGPYGTVPEMMSFDKIIFVAGGSGASYTFGLALDLLDQMDKDATKDIVFVWAVRTYENLSWFKDHLKKLETHDQSLKVKTTCHVTHPAKGSRYSTEESGGDASPIKETPPQTSIPTAPATAPTRTPQRVIKSALKPTSNAPVPALPPLPDTAVSLSRPPLTSQRCSAQRCGNAGTLERDLEKTNPIRPPEGPDELHFLHKAVHGRPDVEILIREAVSSTPKNERVLIAACGPPGMMKVVRDTVAGSILPDGPGVELHCEQFSW